MNTDTSIRDDDADADGYSRHGWLPRGSDGLRYRLGVASRAFAAIAGGYVLSALVATACAIWFPGTRAEGAILGMLVSFVTYTLAVMWVFAVRTAGRAWLGLLLPSIALGLAIGAHLYLHSAP
ncbi:DUF3649 domain-containing protein [Diaphorobacter nitroreducens]|uniref:DUF3649 domain-containing protein n=1 Tax=Diaphorobacter nitroreducens TaxID=164759 RepID=UPI0035B0A125